VLHTTLSPRFLLNLQAVIRDANRQEMVSADLVPAFDPNNDMAIFASDHLFT
jgi:hypothetical protein